MPQVDMPLDKLKVYMGTNNKPEDFDRYWEESLNELAECEDNLEIVEAEFQVSFASCYDVYFTGVGGSKIHCKYVRPRHVEGKIPGLIRFHGYSMSADEWDSLLKYPAIGYAVIAMDCRGQGGESEDLDGTSGTSMFGHIIRGVADGPKGLLFRKIFLDTAQTARILMSMSEIDENKIAVAGGSQGGALTLACASLVPEIGLVMPVFPFLSDYKRVWNMDLAEAAYEGITQYLRRFDPRHERIDEFFNTLGYIDIHHLTSRIKGRVHMATGLMDPICPPSTQFAAYNHITSPKKMVLYPDFKHEHLPGWGEIELQQLMDFAKK